MHLVNIAAVTLTLLSNCLPCIESQVRIIGGRTAMIENVPFFALINLQFILNRKHKHNRFGGAIIDHQWILTAAHCFDSLIELDEQLESELIVSVATDHVNNMRQPGFHQKKAKWFLHEKYDSMDIINDIALIKLDTPLEFSEKVSAIPLPQAYLEEKKYTKGKVIGFGAISETSFSGHSQLMQVEIDLFHDDKYCSAKQNLYKAEFMFCAGDKEGRKDSCYGDSGGPLFVQRPDGSYFLAGIVSFSTRGCARKDTPAFYTRVSSYLDWIRNFTDKNK